MSTLADGGGAGDPDCRGARGASPASVARHVRTGSLRFAASAVTSHVEHDEHDGARGAGPADGSGPPAGPDESCPAVDGPPAEVAALVADAARDAARGRTALLESVLALGDGLYGRIEDTHGATAVTGADGRTRLSAVARRGVIVTTVRDGLRRTRAVCGPPDGIDVAGLVRPPLPLPAHRGPLPDRVIWEPLALAELLAEYASVGLALQDPAGAREFAGRAGARVAAPGVDITDDPVALGGWALDAEGSSAGRLPLVRDGLLAGWATDRAGGAALGRPSTGHASRSVGGLRCYPASLVLDCPPAAAPSGRWLRVERVQYISVVDAATGTVTGSTRDHCVVVEDGEPVATAGTVRFTLAVPDLLRRITGRLGAAATVPVTWGGCVVRTPAVSCDDLRLTQ